MASATTGTGGPQCGRPVTSGRRGNRLAHARLAIVVFLALMGLMAARYVGLEHDPRRAAEAQRSIAETFAMPTHDPVPVQPLDHDAGAAAGLRRTGTMSPDPAQVEAGGTAGEVRLVLADATLFEPATARLRSDAVPRIGRLVEQVFGTQAMRLEIVLNDSNLNDPSTAEKIERLVGLMQGLGLPRTRVAFGSGPAAPSTWLLEAARTGRP